MHADCSDAHGAECGLCTELQLDYTCRNSVVRTRNPIDAAIPANTSKPFMYTPA
jgi:hypothetical protein